MLLENTIQPITVTKKSKIYTSIYEKKDEIFNIDSLKGYEYNIREFYLPNLFRKEVKGYFECFFLQGNVAWLSRSKEGIWRYFTRSKYKLVHAFDIIDLLAIYFNTNFKGVMMKLKDFNFKYSNIWREQQLKKYDDNIFFINNILDKYENLNKLLGKHKELLLYMNSFAKENMSSNKIKYKSQAIFFISTSYIKINYSPGSSISTINQLVNLLVVLGFINKVPHKYPGIKYEEDNGLSAINYYTISKFDSVIKEAEKRAKLLNDNNIKYYNIKKSTLINLFGVTFADNVYPTKLGGGDKKKISKACNKERELLEELFNVSLTDKGYVSRENIKLNSNILSEKSFEKFWLTLINRYDGETIIPNSNIKQKLNLKTKQGIFFKEKGQEVYNHINK